VYLLLHFNFLHFSRILLKFEKLRQVLAYIKAVFVSKSRGNSGLNYDGLKNALKILHGPMERYQFILSYCLAFTKITVQRRNH
jgi:hypothetical protein